MAEHVVVKHMGYSSLNGAALGALSALRKFGILVQDPARRLRLSDDVITVLAHPEDAGPRTEALRRLALQPALFKELLAEFPNDLPSDVNLRARLISERKFNPEAADRLLVALRDTVEVAGLSTSAFEPAPAIDETHADDPRMTTLVAPGAGPRAPTAVEQRWDLGDVTVTLSSSRALTSDDYDLLLDYVTAAKKAAERRRSKEEQPQH